MYITVDNIKNEVSLYYPIDNRNGDKKIGLIRAYVIYSFYNVKNDENIHLNPLRVGDFSSHPSRATEEFSQNN